MGSEGASCFNLLSDDGRDVSLPEWDEERVGMICTKAETFSEWQGAIIKLCNLTRRCKYDVVKNVVAFGDKILDFKKLTGEQNERVKKIERDSI